MTASRDFNYDHRHVPQFTGVVVLGVGVGVVVVVVAVGDSVPKTVKKCDQDFVNVIA